MKSLVILFFGLLLSSQTLAKGIEFFEGSLEEAKQSAAEQGRLIFIDAYTTWCGPCKRMSAQVFTKDEVGEFYNSAFVNLKLDMEKGEGKAFQRKYRVTAFPTLLFLDSEGKVIHRVVGGMDVPNFLKLGKFAATKSGFDSKLDAAYEDGLRDPAFMAKYIASLAKSNRPLLKVANEYLSGQKNYKTEENLSIIYHATVQADSRIFNLLIKHKPEIEKLFGKVDVEQKIEKAATATVEKAIEYDNSDLLEEAIEKVKRYAGSRHKDFENQSRLKFFAETQRDEEYLKYAKIYARGGTDNKFELANYILHNKKSVTPLVDHALKWSLEAVKDVENEEHCFTTAQLYYIKGNFSKSRKFAETALEISQKKKSGATPHIKGLLNAIDQKIGS